MPPTARRAVAALATPCAAGIGRQRQSALILLLACTCACAHSLSSKPTQRVLPRDSSEMLHTSAVLETAKGAHPLRAAPAGRRVDRGRLVVAAAGPSPPPAEPPSTSPPLGSPSLGAWALSAPETAARAFSSLRGKVAAAHEVRAAQRARLPFPTCACFFYHVPATAASLPSGHLPLPFPHLDPHLQKHGKSARTAVQAWLGGPDMWVSRQDLALYSTAKRKEKSGGVGGGAAPPILEKTPAQPITAYLLGNKNALRWHDKRARRDALRRPLAQLDATWAVHAWPHPPNAFTGAMCCTKDFH
mgnify:CR=1 FL=1